MSEKHTGKALHQQMSESDWKRFHSMSDEDIDTSDIPELEINDEFWQKAKVIIPVKKQSISRQINEDTSERGKIKQVVVKEKLIMLLEDYL